VIYGTRVHPRVYREHFEMIDSAPDCPVIFPVKINERLRRTDAVGAEILIATNIAIVFCRSPHPRIRAVTISRAFLQNYSLDRRNTSSGGFQLLDKSD